MKTAALAMGAFAFFAAQSQASVLFNYPNFSSTSGLTPLGTATTSSGALQLTGAVTGNNAGMAYTTSEVTLGTDDSFSTTFQFQLTNPNGTFGPGNGIAFMLSANTPVLGSAGENLGFANTADTDNTDSLAIALNTYNYGSGDGHSSNNVAIDTNGTLNSTVTNVYGTSTCTSTYASGCMSNGDTWTATISYDGTNLTVILQDPTEGSSFTVTDSNLTSILGGANTAYVALSGGTGDAWEDQDILNWQMSNTAIVPEPGSLALLIVGLAAMPLLKLAKR